MNKVIINIKDKNKLSFLSELLAQFDWLDFKIKQEEEKTAAAEEEYDFFASAGMMKDREIDSNELRQKAWKTGK